MAGTVTRADLADVVRRTSSITGAEASELVDQIIEEICVSLERGEHVKLSSFATFSLSDKGARIGRNPRTGEEKMISPRRVVTFNAAPNMKARVTAGKGGRK